MAGEYQRVAAAVIFQALKDLVKPHAAQHATSRGSVNATHHSAKEFLCVGSEDLSFWCSVAGWSPEVVTTFAKKLLSGEISSKRLTEVMSS